MPKKYRLIMYTIEAIKIEPDSVKRAAAWCGGAITETYDAIDSTKKFVALNLPTMDGIKRAGEGDYVIKNADGRFDVALKREFESKYVIAD